MISPPSSTGPATFYFKASRQPMLWTAYALGFLFGRYEWRPNTWWLIGLMAFIAGAAYFTSRRSGFAGLLALGSFFLAGALHIQLRANCDRLDTTILPYADRQEVEVTAQVTRDGRLHQNEFSKTRQSLDVEAEQIQTATGEIVPTHSGIRLNIYSPRTGAENPPATATWNEIRVCRYGERLRFSAKLKPRRNFRNQGAFDYRAYLADHGITDLGSAKLENVELLPGFAGNKIMLRRSRMHRSVLEKVNALWPPREAALLDAMVIGAAAFIDRDTRVDFQRSGTYHVLVVSGMNISILAFVVFWTPRRLRLSEIPATLATVGFCVGYAFITEVGAPVWRATFMCAVYLGTRLPYRDRAMLNALGAPALGLLIYDPRQPFSPSFQMTFLCVLIVAGVGIPFLERTSQLYKLALANWDSRDFAMSLPPAVAQFRLDLQLCLSPLVLRTQAVGGSLGAQLHSLGTLTFRTVFCLRRHADRLRPPDGLLLPSRHHHRSSGESCCRSVTQLMMPTAVAALGLGYASPFLAKLPALVTTLALACITGTVHGLGGLRLADLRVAMPSLLVSTLAASALMSALWTARRRALLTITGLLALLLSSLALAFLRPQPLAHPDVLEVTSVDVGEGDSILLVTPQGRTLLIDAGGPIGPAALNLTSAKTSSRPICGRAGSPASMPSRSLMDVPITSAA